MSQGLYNKYLMNNIIQIIYLLSSHKGNAKKVSKDSPMGRDSEEELDQSLSSLVLSNGASDKETEDVDDLLEYYRLQKT
jgi:hypothetical protein